MGDENNSVIDASNEVIVLAFDLLESELPLLPSQLEKALMSAEVQASISKTLQQFAETKIKTGTTVVTADEGKKLLDSLQSGVQGAATKSLEDQIKKTPQYQKLEKSLTEFQKSIKASEFGIFVDEHKMVLYIIGAALVVGGAGALYITQSGGSIVKPAMDLLKNKDFKVLAIGGFNLSVGNFTFKPDARILGGEVGMVQKWKRVELQMKFGILAEGPKVQEIKGEVIVKSGAFSLTGTTDIKPYAQHVNLGLKFNYSQDFGRDKFSLSLGALYEDKNVQGTLGASYQMNKGPTFGLTGAMGQVGGSKPAYSGLLTLTIPIK